MLIAADCLESHAVTKASFTLQAKLANPIFFFFAHVIFLRRDLSLTFYVTLEIRRNSALSGVTLRTQTWTTAVMELVSQRDRD